MQILIIILVSLAQSLIYEHITNSQNSRHFCMAFLPFSHVGGSPYHSSVSRSHVIVFLPAILQPASQTYSTVMYSFLASVDVCLYAFATFGGCSQSSYLAEFIAANDEVILKIIIHQNHGKLVVGFAWRLLWGLQLLQLFYGKII